MSHFFRLYSLFESKQKYIFFFLIFLMLINMFLEILGISLIIPALSFITDNTFCNEYCYYLLNKLDINYDKYTFFIILFITILTLFFIKSLFISYLIYKQNKTIQTQLSLFSQKLYNYYLRESYLFHVEKNSSILIRNIIQEISAVITNYLNSFLYLLTESLLMFGILLILFIYQPYGLIFSLVFFGIFSFFISKFTKKKVRKWGKIRQTNEEKKLRHLMQSFNSIKEVKLYSKENYFEKINQETFETHARINTYNSVLNSLTRPWLEFFLILSMTLLVVFLIYIGNSYNEIISTIGLFAVAAFKLLPSINKILISIQSMRFTQDAVDLVFNEFQKIKTQSILNNNKVNEQIKFKEIKFSNVKVKYPSRQNTTLKSINLKILSNHFIGIIGASGAGKSTFIDTFLGLLPIQDGKIYIDDNLFNLNNQQWKNAIGYVPQNVYLVDDSISKNIAFGIEEKLINYDKINKIIKIIKLEELINSLENGIDTFVGEKGVRLSGGQKQRIAIARALYRDPKILILDEATSSLDIFTEREIMNFIYSLKKNITVLIVSHRLSSVEKCDYIYEFENGIIVDEGKSSEVINKIKDKYSN